MTAAPDAHLGEQIHMRLFRDRTTTTEFARVLGISKATASQKLHGDRKWTLTELLRAADYLGVEVADLLPAPETCRLTAGRSARLSYAGLTSSGYRHLHSVA